jgi:hypothetical protein
MEMMTSASHTLKSIRNRKHVSTHANGNLDNNNKHYCAYVSTMQKFHITIISEIFYNLKM